MRYHPTNQLASHNKISVILPNFNYKKYLKSRLRSILNQTYPIHELIILDDHSTDGSVEYIQSILPILQRKYQNITFKFFPNDRNSGRAIAQWRKGFKLATGDYIWIAEADDLSSKYFLEEVMKGFNCSSIRYSATPDSIPKVVLSYSESMLINSKGLIIAPNFRWSRDREKTRHYKKSYIKDGKEEIKEIMSIRCTIPNVSSVVFLRDKHFSKYLDEALKFTQVGDWYFYTRVLAHGKISYCRKSLNRFRIHSQSKTASSKKDKRHFQEVCTMHKILMTEYNLSSTVIDSIKAEEYRLKLRVKNNM